MSLRAKFGLLLGVLAFIVAVSLGTSLVFGAFLERELTLPFQAMTRVLAQLSATKRAVGRQTRTLPGPGRDEPGLGILTAEAPRYRAMEAEYEPLCEGVDRAFDALRENVEFQKIVGVGATRSLIAQAQEARRTARLWFREGSIKVGIEAGEAHFQIHELIERMESRLLEDSASALGYGQDLRRIHQSVLGAGIASSLMAAALGVALFSRWVMRPVGDLRLAASRIGAGEYEHRAPVRSVDELGQLAVEVNRMAELVSKAQAEAVERERLAAAGALVRKLAHNLRNPLAAIRGLAELTSRRARDNEQIRNDQGEIVAAVDRFNDWLSELTQANAPLELLRTRTEQCEWWERVLASQRPLARKRSVKLVTRFGELPREPEIDAGRMEHAMVILLTNAIQASPAGGTVTIASAWIEGEGCWQIEVSDQGSGVPDALKDKIFRPYFTTKPDGNGIGLAIARQVIHGHGGSIVVLDGEGGGARFVVRIPLGV